jgi:predicted Zn-dependent peptidase
MDHKHTTLDNGLDILAEINPAAESLAAGFFVRTGSRDETPDVAGVSHFLEHMVFKGTERRSAADVNLDYDRMGASYNAFTSEENTVYYAAVLPEYQHDVLDVLCDILRPALREDDFQTEKGVICEEIAMYQDMPHFRLYDNLMTLHFTGHPLGNEILGSTESITNMARDDMQAYFDRRYSPTNVTLVASGAIDFDALVDQARSMCGHWTPFDAPRDDTAFDGARTGKCIVDAKLARQSIGLMTAAPSMQDDERFAADVLATVLGDGTGSRLYYALIETALADEASMSYSPMDGSGGLLTFLSASPDRANEVLNVAREVFATFLAEGATAEETQAAANKIATAATIKGEQPMGRLTAVGFDWQYRREYQPLAEQIEMTLAVTPDDIHDLARRCRLDEPTVLGLGPKETLPGVNA